MHRYEKVIPTILERWSRRTLQEQRSKNIQAWGDQGAIHVAWSLKKTDILKDQIEEVKKEIASKCSTDILKKFQTSKKTVEKNAECVDAAASALRETQENLTTTRQEFLDSTNKSERKLAAVRVDKIEKDFDAQLAELRRAQDALQKATEARKKLSQLEVESQTAGSDSDDSTC